MHRVAARRLCISGDGRLARRHHAYETLTARAMFILIICPFLPTFVEYFSPIAPFRPFLEYDQITRLLK
jgi:hypothetical protein